MCTVLLPPGVNPIAVNKCIISYIILYIIYITLSKKAGISMQSSWIVVTHLHDKPTDAPITYY